MDLKEMQQRQAVMRDFLDNQPSPDPMIGITFWLAEVAIQIAQSNRQGGPRRKPGTR